MAPWPPDLHTETVPAAGLCGHTRYLTRSAMDNFHVLRVGEVTTYLKALLGSDDVLGDLWVRGEVSNLSRSAAGHTYFTLKDEAGQLRFVMFRGSGFGTHDLDHGAGVLVHGHVGLYEAQGSVQLYADFVQAEGVGSLHQQFEDLKARLADEGLFDDERKRPLPPFPRRIGVVTSPQAAAFQDVLKVLAARFPAVEVVLSPCLVQGDGAPAQIVAALERLNDLDGIDVILVVRGGGSLEELWAFNDEQVARAIGACTRPVVSGVGHETDFTIADLVADVRMPTPRRLPPPWCRIGANARPTWRALARRCARRWATSSTWRGVRSPMPRARSRCSARCIACAPAASRSTTWPAPCTRRWPTCWGCAGPGWSPPWDAWPRSIRWPRWSAATPSSPTCGARWCATRRR